MIKNKFNLVISLLIAFSLIAMLQACQPFVQPNEASSPLYSVNVDNKWGYIDTFGNVVVKPQYLQEGYYYGDRLVVRDDTSSLIIDRNGKKIFRISNNSMPIDFNGNWFKIDELRDSIRFYNLNNRKHLSIARKGITNAHADFEASNRALIIFGSNKGYGYLNKSGKMVFTVTKGVANFFDGGTDLAAVEFESKTFHGVDTYFVVAIAILVAGIFSLAVINRFMFITLN